MLKRRFTRRTAIAAVFVVAGTAGAASGFAFGLTGDDLAPAGVSADPDGSPVAPRVAPDYPQNASGLTYGSVELVNSPEDEPDLILVETQTGTTGYVKKGQLNRVTGATVSSPEEAIAWEARADNGQATTIPVYAQDGITVVGQFDIAPAE